MAFGDMLKAQRSGPRFQDVTRVFNAVARGDLFQKITVPVQGVVVVRLKDVINTMIDKLGQFAKEVTRVSQDVGTEGYAPIDQGTSDLSQLNRKLGGQALVLDVEGTYRKFTTVVNKLATNLTSQVRNLLVIHVDVEGTWGMNITSRSTIYSEDDRRSNVFLLLQIAYRSSAAIRSCHDRRRPVAKGDLTQKIEISVEGEMSTLKETVISMVGRLSVFASEATRVALEERQQNGFEFDDQLVDVDVQGKMLDLKMTVNSMVAQSSTLANDVTRGTWKVAVAGGDLTKKIDVDVWRDLGMTESMSVFADKVTRVVRKVEMEGRLGGQARVTNVGGMWKDLTDNVNVIANDLTLQMRIIAILLYTLCTTGGTRSRFDSSYYPQSSIESRPHPLR
ncbi:hypothetical protein BYT27DRAFT_7249003 [Phlegmacium glaucopus]|nr:hypothetical protein BYT27DRAFT_7249003 [Phlegmacium glaucopus]